MIKLDYNLETIEERKALVEKILEEQPKPSSQYLEILADYLVLCMEKEEKKEKKILTDNRLATVNKRETSYEGLVSKFENGERVPPTETLMRLAEFYNVSIDYILCRTNKAEINR